MKSNTTHQSDESSERMEKIDKFVANQQRLLRVEQLAVTRQAKKQLKELGNIVEVKVVDSRAQTRYGGSRLKLERRDSGSRVPKFNVGESIALDADDDEDSEPIHGILKKVFLNTYEVELEISESVEVFKEKRSWDLMKRNDNASFKQMEEALKKISQQASPLRDVLLGLQQPSSVPAQDSSLLFQNNCLDPSQRKADTRSSGHWEDEHSGGDHSPGSQGEGEGPGDGWQPRGGGQHRGEARGGGTEDPQTWSSR